MIRRPSSSLPARATQSRLGRLGTVMVSAVLVPLLALSVAPATAGPVNPGSVRVLSYNIHHGEGLDGELDLQRIADEIEATGADVIGLQEVDNHWGDRSGWQDQAAELAELLDMHYAYGANLDLDPGEGQTERRQYGVAVLSRYPILSAQNHLLTNIEYPDRPTEQRGVLHTVINYRGAHLDFYNTHLDHQRAEQRISQVSEILDIVDQSRGTAILVGDLNTTPETTEVSMLTTDGPFVDAFGDSDGDFTYPAEDATKRIDYILAADALEITEPAVLTTQASDHLPIAATVSFRRPQR